MWGRTAWCPTEESDGPRRECSFESSLATDPRQNAIRDVDGPVASRARPSNNGGGRIAPATRACRGASESPVALETGTETQARERTRGSEGRRSTRSGSCTTMSYRHLASPTVANRKNISTSFTPKQAPFLAGCVSSGRYPSTSEVVREAVRLLEHQLARREAEPPPQRGSQRGKETSSGLWAWPAL
jgi:putative addiction module CopG family antidote